MTITLLEAIKYFDKPNKHGLQPFKSNREWGLRNRAEKKNVVRNTYAKVKSKHPNSYYLAQRNDKWAIISPSGERLTPLKYEEVEETSNPSYILVQNYKGYWGVVKADDGSIKILLQYRTRGTLVKPIGGYWFNKNWQQSGNKEFFDKDFNSIKPAKVDIWLEAKKLYGNLYEVENDSGEKGVWDKKTDTMTISFGKYTSIEYEEAAYGNPPYFIVRDQNFNAGIIDLLNDNVLLPIGYDSIEPLAKFNLFYIYDYYSASSGIYNLKTKSWVISYGKQDIQAIFTKNGLFFRVNNTKDKEGIVKYNEQTNMAKWVVPQAFDNISYESGIFYCTIGEKANKVVIKYWPTKGFLSKDYHTVIKSVF